MPVIEIEPDVYWVGVNDRTTDFFESLWPITREGVAYNSYLINDEKQALVDTVKSFRVSDFLHQVQEAADISQIDSLIINHMEPDHSGALHFLQRFAPKITFVGTQKTKEELAAFYGIKENVKIVQDGETLCLGKRTLKFISTPMVHWPETMMTYETSHRILFSGDGFGGFGAHRGGIFDDECADIDGYIKETLRYFTNIVAKFSMMVLKAIDKLGDTPIETVAPSHGLVWRREPQRIVELYKKWAGYATGKAENAITLVYGSMYGNTEVMGNAVAQGIARTCVPLEIFDAARTHASYIIPYLRIRAGVVIGAPTYDAGLFPPIAHVLDVAVRKGIRNKKVLRFGSFGWAGGAQREFEKIIECAKWELIDSFEFMGQPTKDDLKKGEAMGQKLDEIIQSE